MCEGMKAIIYVCLLSLPASLAATLYGLRLMHDTMPTPLWWAVIASYVFTALAVTIALDKRQ